MILSAGIVPIRKSEGSWQFLMLRCFKYWDFPKGEVNSHEDPLAAALRELGEETSIASVHFNWGKSYFETEPYSKGKIARYYLAEVQGSPEIKLLPNPETGLVEHHEFRWFSPSTALEIANPRIKRVIEWAQVSLSKSRDQSSSANWLASP